MQDISLLTNVDTQDAKGEDQEKVSLMTVHSAKGLEFAYVYIVGLEENLFPSQLSVNSRADLEEERRLFYVAITRAEKIATLSFATMRYRFGNITYCEPSRFIDEINESILELPHENKGPAFNDQLFDSFRSDYDSPSKNKSTSQSDFDNKINFKPANKKLIRIQSSILKSSHEPVDVALNKSLRDMDVVMHEKFGKGQIIQLEGNWPETKALIQFEKAGNKSLLLKFARLQKL